MSKHTKIGMYGMMPKDWAETHTAAAIISLALVITGNSRS